MSKNMQVQLWPPFKRSGTTITQRTSGDTINSTGNFTFGVNALALNAPNLADSNYATFGARDNDTDAIVEVARLAGASDPYFATGGSQQFKFYNAGTALFGSVVTTDATTIEIGAAGVIKSGGTNADTMLLAANDTTFITFTTGDTDTCVLASGVTGTTQSAADNSTKLATTAYVDAAVGTVNSFAEILALSNITGANNIVVSTTQGINTALVDDNYFTIGAVDNDPNTIAEVARAQGAADPYFSAGGTQQFKFYNSGVAVFDGAATSAAFIDISPTLTGPAATNTYAVNISPVGITIPTGTTAISASLYVAEPIFTETGVLTLASNVYIDAAPTEGGTNYSLYVVGTSYLNGAITAPGGLTGNITGDCSGSSGTCTGNAGTVTNGVYTTDTGTVTAKMLQNAAADLGAASITVDLSNTNGAYVTNLTIDGAFSGLTYNGLTITANGTNTLNISAGQTLTVSGSATITGALGTGAYATIADYALVGQQFYIGTTQVAINRASAALTLAGITLTTPDIGTPSAGVLTSCTGLPAAAVVAGSFGTGAYVMDSSLQVSTIELGHATQNTLSASGGVLSVEGVVIPSISSTNTLTNKRITQRVVTTTDDATAVIDIDVTDVYQLSAIANNTEFTTTGTPTDGQKLIIRLKDAGVSKSLTWTGFTAVGVTLPAATTVSKWHYIGATYNLAATAWHCIAVSEEA